MYKITKYCCNYNGLLTIKHNLILQEQLDEVKNLLNIENTELYQFIIDKIEKFKNKREPLDSLIFTLLKIFLKKVFL